MSTPLYSVDECGAGAFPCPKAPATPPLSRKSESKIMKPLAADKEAIGPLEPPYAPLLPIVLLGVVDIPLYSQTAFTEDPEFDHVEGMPDVKSKLYKVSFGGAGIFWFISVIIRGYNW